MVNYIHTYTIRLNCMMNYIHTKIHSKRTAIWDPFTIFVKTKTLSLSPQQTPMLCCAVSLSQGGY